MSDFTVDRDSTKRVLGSTGTLVSYGTDEPAFEFNADGSYRGLLVEPAATNLCLQSEDISTTWLNNPNSLDDTNVTTAPDGTTTADRLKDDEGGGTGTVYVYQQAITATGNTKYTASVFLKADQLAFARLYANQYDGATNGYQTFGLSGAGTLGTASNLDDSSIQAYPNGWYRCSITWTQGVGDTSFNFSILAAKSISNEIVDRDGTSSIFVWGAQVEAGAIATSYIPTTTASVTRAKDDISLTSASSLIGQTAGTLYVEVDWREADGASQYLLELSDGTANNQIVIYKTPSTDELIMYIEANDVLITNQGQSVSGYSGIQKFAFAYATDDAVLYRNGTSISSESGAGTVDLSALATLTDIDLGQSVTAGGQANMHIRAIAVFDSRLSNTDLATLTTL